MEIYICDKCGKIKEDHYTLNDGMFCDCPMPFGGPVPRFRPFTVQDALQLKTNLTEAYVALQIYNSQRDSYNLSDSEKEMQARALQKAAEVK